MADSFTSSLRLRLQQTGANNNTWGGLLNAAALQLIEDSISGRVVITLAGVNVTLSTANGANDQARMAVLSLQGAPGATREVIVPTSSKWYIVENLTANEQTVKTAAGTGVSIAVGDRKIVMCDGTNVVGVADTLGGLSASDFARLAVRNSYSAGNSDVPVTLTDGGTITVNFALGNVFKVTLGGDRTMAFSNPVDGTWAEIYALQDATGGRDLTLPSNIIWEGGAAPAPSTLPNTTVRYFLRYDIDTTTYWGFASEDLSTGGAAVTAIELASNDFNVDIFERAGRPAGATTITVTIPAGILIASMDTATPALDFAGFALGSTINIINNGDIQGCGGKGARGGSAGDANSANLFFAAANASPGGDAIRLPSAVCTINITNANGRIWGGGGGGGGGGPSHDGDGSDVGSTGGGGGGGAGGGIPGEGGSHCAAKGNPGTPGGRGRNGTFGTGGTGTTSGGTGTAATGGNGGDWGSTGSNGTAQTAQTFDAPAGTGGAAGKAINQNGGSAPTFISGSGSPNVKGAVA